MDIVQFKHTLQPYLEKTLEDTMQRCLFDAPNPLVQEAVRHVSEIILAGGKRARPFVAYTMYSCLGGTEVDNIAELVCAFELFHAFALVHDDLIDHGLIRHGIPTLHAHLKRYMYSQGRLGDIDHIARSQALLVGDLLANWSFEILERTVPVNKMGSVLTQFHQMMNRVVLGEMLDLDVTTFADVSETEILRKTELKTAWYTFIYPMKIGAILSGAPEEMLSFCEMYGQDIGLAFQLQDDILDVYGSSAGIQKSVMLEIVNGQHTMLTEYVMHKAPARYRRELERIRGCNSVDPNRLRWLFTSCGAETYVRSEVTRYFDSARNMVFQQNVSEDTRSAWVGLVDYLAARTA